MRRFSPFSVAPDCPTAPDSEPPWPGSITKSTVVTRSPESRVTSLPHGVSARNPPADAGPMTGKTTPVEVTMTPPSLAGAEAATVGAAVVDVGAAVVVVVEVVDVVVVLVVVVVLGATSTSSKSSDSSRSSTSIADSELVIGPTAARSATPESVSLASSAETICPATSTSTSSGETSARGPRSTNSPSALVSTAARSPGDCARSSAWGAPVGGSESNAAIMHSVHAAAKSM